MQRLNIKENGITFNIYEGDLHQVNNEDGVGFYPISWVVASFNNNKYFYPLHFLAKFVYVDDNDDGRVFFNSRELCNDFISKVKDFGSIDLNKWEIAV